jgi:outer membrane porin, OprD family.
VHEINPQEEQNAVKNKAIVWSAAALLAGCGSAHAETIAQWLSHSHIDGNLRNYYFTQTFTGSAPNTSAYSLGGKIEIATQPVYGLSADVAFYTANDLGVNDAHDPKRIDALLMGTNHTLNTVGQSYLQYQDHWLRLRAGNQLLDTPWMWGADAFMVPNTFEALDAVITPTPGLSIEALRSLRYKYRARPDFGRYSLLNLGPSADLYPNLPDTDNGAMAVGIRGDGAPVGVRGAKAQVWLYKFYNFANLFYADGGYTLPMGAWSPFVDGQIAREWNNGAALLGPVNATIYGVKLGLHTPIGVFHWAYNQTPTRTAYTPPGGVRTLYNGNFVSPYEEQNNIDPLYTTIMDYGMVSVSAPGHAWQAGFADHPLRQVKFEYTFTRYDTEPYYGNVTANTLDVTYLPGHFFKGLSLRNRLSIDHGFRNVANVPSGTFYDERVMIQYSFSS